MLALLTLQISFKSKILLGLLAFSTVVFFFGLPVKMGSFFGSSLFGIGQKVDTTEIEAGMLDDKATQAVQLGEFEKAVDYYSQLILNESHKTPERTAFTIAQIYEDNLHSFNDANYWFRKTIALSRKRENAASNVYAQESQKAIDRLEKFVGKDVGDEKNDLQAIRDAISSENFDHALIKLEEAEKLYPKNAELALVHAQYFQALNNPGMAIAHLEKAMEYDPKNKQGAYLIACAQQDFDHLLEAKDSFTNYLKLAGDDINEQDRILSAKERQEEINRKLDNPTLDFEGTAY